MHAAGSGAGNWKLETGYGNWKLEMEYGNWKLEIGKWKVEWHLSATVVSSSTVFFFDSYMHIHAPYCSSQEINCSHTFKRAYVRRVTELHLSTKFHVCQCRG